MATATIPPYKKAGLWKDLGIGQPSPEAKRITKLMGINAESCYNYLFHEMENYRTLTKPSGKMHGGINLLIGQKRNLIDYSIEIAWRMLWKTKNSFPDKYQRTIEGKEGLFMPILLLGKENQTFHHRVYEDKFGYYNQHSFYHDFKSVLVKNRKLLSSSLVFTHTNGVRTAGFDIFSDIIGDVAYINLKYVLGPEFIFPKSV